MSTIAPHTGRRRGFKSFIVEPYSQVKLGLMFLMVNTLFSILIAGVFGYYIYDVYATVAAHFKMAGQESQFTMMKFATPLIAGGLLMILFVLTTLMVSIRYTHEIYGPLVSIHRFLDELLAGTMPSPLQLRESDQLQDLASRLNEIAQRHGPGPGSKADMLGAIARFVNELSEGKNPTPIYWRESDAVPQSIRDIGNKLNLISEKLAKKSL